MKPEHRQLVLLIGFMALLTATVLFLFVYAPEPLEIVYPGVSEFKDVGGAILENFNIFSYL